MIAVAAHIAAKIQIYLRDNRRTTKRVHWYGECAIFAVTRDYAMRADKQSCTIARDLHISSGILAATLRPSVNLST